MKQCVVVGVMVTWRARHLVDSISGGKKKMGRAARQTQKKWLRGSYSSRSLEFGYIELSRGARLGDRVGGAKLEERAWLVWPGVE